MQNKWALACLKVLPINYLFTNSIFKNVYKLDLASNNLHGWYAIKYNQSKMSFHDSPCPPFSFFFQTYFHNFWMEILHVLTNCFFILAQMSLQGKFWNGVRRCDRLNINVENKIVKRILAPDNFQMIGIKSWVNKDYTIQFNIKSRKVEATNRQIQYQPDVSFSLQEIPY